MELAPYIGLVVGLLVGHMIAAMIAGGGYEYVGGNLFEVVREPMGCIKGCVIEIVAVGLGGGAGFVIGSMLAG